MLKLPKFANEAQEAQWWFDNQALVADELDRQEPKAGMSPAVTRLAEIRGISVEEMLAQLRGQNASAGSEPVPEFSRSL